MFHVEIPYVENSTIFDDIWTSELSDNFANFTLDFTPGDLFEIKKYFSNVIILLLFLDIVVWGWRFYRGNFILNRKRYAKDTVGLYQNKNVLEKLRTFDKVFVWEGDNPKTKRFFGRLQDICYQLLKNECKIEKLRGEKYCLYIDSICPLTADKLIQTLSSLEEKHDFTFHTIFWSAFMKQGNNISQVEILKNGDIDILQPRQTHLGGILTASPRYLEILKLGYSLDQYIALSYYIPHNRQTRKVIMEFAKNRVSPDL